MYNAAINMNKNDNLFNFLGIQVESFLDHLLSRSTHQDVFLSDTSEPVCWKNVTGTSSNKTIEILREEFAGNLNLSCL